MSNVTHEDISELVARCGRVMERIKERNLAPDHTKRLDRTWSVNALVTMLTKTAQGIYKAAETIQIGTRQPGRRVEFNLDEVHKLRDHFKMSMQRAPSDPLAVTGILNFKGGVAKSTFAVHAAQYLAMMGMRVLLVDTDPQASTTYLMGYFPDKDIKWEQTLAPYMVGQQTDLRYCIRDTHWPGLKFIPSNMSLFSTEWTLALKVARAAQSNDLISGIKQWTRLRDGVRAIGDDFDVVVIDGPPSSGIISMNVLYASNMMVVPMPPGMLDFASTAQFFTMVKDMLEDLNTAFGEDASRSTMEWIKVLVSRKRQKASSDTGDSDKKPDSKIEDDIASITRDVFGNYMLRSVLYESEEIKTATAVRKTLYELNEPLGSDRTHKRALKTMDTVCSEVSQLIRLSWPSHEGREDLEQVA